MLFSREVVLAVLCALPAAAQSADPHSAATPTAAGAVPAQSPEDKRIFGVLPNNRTAEASSPFHPITPKQKMTIAFKDSFDWPVYITAGLFATLYQLEDQNPSFGLGMAGYGRRVGTAYGDQLIGNMMTEGIVPAVFHQDPRYFRLGEGSKAHRAWYAVTRIVVARMDSGRNSFNFSEWGGNAAAVAISNFYYPDTRNVSDNVSKLLIQCSTDAFSNVLKEFWPDVKNRLHRKSNRDVPSQALSSISAADR